MAGKKDPHTSDQQRFERWTGSDRKWDSRRMKREEILFKEVLQACNKFLESRGLSTDFDGHYLNFDQSRPEEAKLLTGFNQTTQ